MKTRSTFLYSLLCAAFWLTACVEGEIEGGDGSGGVVTPQDLLQVEIPTGVTPLQVTEPLDTKSSALKSADTKSAAPVQPQDSTALPALSASPSLSAPSASDTLSSPATRAEGDLVYPRAIILQYDASTGALLNSGSTYIDEYTIGSSISASLMESESCNIHVLVINNKLIAGTEDNFSTEAKLKANSYGLYVYFSNPTDKDIPLFGSLSNVRINRIPVSDGTEKGMILNTDGRPVKVELRRIAAKLVVDFSYEAAGFEAGENVFVMDIPKSFPFVEGSGEFPDVNGEFVNRSFKISDRDGDNNDQPRTSFVYYVPDNRRGEVSSITRPTEKISSVAPEKSTYLTFSATDKKNTSHQLTYRFYFGGNNTTDFNIRRNYVYTLSSAISQTADGDPRVTEGGRLPEVWLDPLVTGVSDTKATMSGKVTRNGATITAVKLGFKKQGDASMTWRTVSLKDADVATYSNAETGLTPNTVYQYAMSITATVGSESKTIESGILSFSTNAAGMPVLTEVALASATNGLSASASGNKVEGNGITEKGVVYSDKENFNHLQEGTRVQATGTDASFAVSLTGLTYGKTYYYRYYAINAQGATYSASTQSFRTKDVPPVPTGGTVTSTEVAQLTFTATLPAKKNAADDVPTAAGVKLWTSEPVNNETAATVTLSFTSPGTSGSKTVNWTSMVAGQKYWYAFYSTNGVGTVYSANQTFTASAALPAPSPATYATGPQAVSGFTVTTARNTNAVSGNPAMATVASGSGSSSIKFNILAYTAKGGSRGSTLTFGTINELPLRSNTTVVTQYGVAQWNTIATVTNGDRAGWTNSTVKLTSNIPVTIKSSASWVKITDTGTLSFDNTQTGSERVLPFTVEPNTGAKRSCTITIKGVDPFALYEGYFTIEQNAGSLYNPSPQGPDEVNNDFSIIEFGNE
ncbi:DUF4906 domain-containing protein [Parabacteroides sp.]